MRDVTLCVLGCFLAAACVPLDLDSAGHDPLDPNLGNPDTATTRAALGPGEDLSSLIDYQGRNLLGNQIPLSTVLASSGYYLYARASTAKRSGIPVHIAVNAGALVSSGSPIDVIFETNLGELRVTDEAALRDPSTGALLGGYEYELDWRATPSDPWQPLCDPDPSDPYDNWAVPSSGAWTARGVRRLAMSDAITFSCRNGVVNKCQNWGWTPWMHPDEHQSCTRMARADYCSHGTTNTLEHTTIARLDLTPGGVNDPAPVIASRSMAAFQPLSIDGEAFWFE
ncbi:MAG: ADYC domain-containing protein, partial [Myxococcota bacterium]